MGRAERDLSPCLFAERCFEFLAVIRQHNICRNFGRDQGRLHVPRKHHLPEDFGLVVFELAFQPVMPAPHEHALAVFENHGCGHVSVTAERHHIQRQVRVAGIGLLASAGSLQRLNGVALFHGGFKIQVGASLFHLALPLVNQVVAFAFQHQARTFYIAGVILLRNQPGAGGATTSDMVIQAGAYWVLGRQLHGTFANAEKPCRNVNQLVDISRTHVGAKILAAILLD